MEDNAAVSSDEEEEGDESCDNGSDEDKDYYNQFDMDLSAL